MERTTSASVEEQETKTDPVHKSNQQNSIQKITLVPTIYNLVFMIAYNDKTSSPKGMFCWWIWCALIMASQLFALFVLSNSFLMSWISDYEKYGSSYVDEQLFKNRSNFIIEIAPLWFFAQISALIVAGTYLMKSIKPFLVLLAICFNQVDPNTNQHSLKLFNYRYGIFISFFNSSITVATWALTIFITFYGLYFTIENPSDIILASIGNVFILELDDYVCEWFTISSCEYTDAFWDIYVDKSRYIRTKKNLTAFYFPITLAIPISFGSASQSIYGWTVDEEGPESLKRNLYLFYIYIFAIVNILCGPVIINRPKYEKLLIIAACALVGIGEIALLFRDAGSLLLSILLTMYGLLMILILVYLDIKKYHKFCNKLFVLFHLSLLIIAIVERIVSSQASIAMYTLLLVIANIFVKFKGADTFKSNRYQE
eukprot:450663_1